MTQIATDSKVVEASARLERESVDLGGPYQEPEIYRGSVARTMFDRPGTEDGSLTILVAESNIDRVLRESYVRIPSVNPRTGSVEAEYLGIVTSGPFAEPDALSASAPTLVVAAAHGAVLTPKYHGMAQVQIFGQKVGDTVVPPLRRPAPNSPVFALPEAEVSRVLGLTSVQADRPFRLGLMEGPLSLAVDVPAARKSVLFKHLGILGTTGGGKSTTVSGTMLKLAAEGNAVVVFDVEGEYSMINQPTEDPTMLAALRDRGLSPGGANKTRLFVLSGREASNPEHPATKEFKIAFSALSPFVLVEILGLNDAQERRFLDAYEVCRMVMEKVKIFPANPAEQQQALDVDELETGWPRMTLPMLIDVVSAAISSTQKTLDDFHPLSAELRGHREDIIAVINARNLEGSAPSWKAVAKRLWRMHKAEVFGLRPQELIDPDQLLEPGYISVVDLSDMDAPYLRNLVIAQILRLVQERQDARYKAAEQQQRSGATVATTKVNIFIEEAHEFLSAQRIKQMPNLFDQVARIARRGRKRYLGLVFVTQLPSHLPDEVFGLVNNWILHKLTDDTVIQRLRKVVPQVTAATWGSLPNFAAGHAVCSFVHLTRPITVAIDPSPCKLRMVD